jgi:ATP-dependent RNA helicase RhlB
VNPDPPVPEDGELIHRSFVSFDLPTPVMAGINAAGFTHCTPIQEKTLPLALAGRDVAAQAQTGTGKTAAFLITIFTRLLAHERVGRPAAPRALVIAPTRELVVQIAEDARLLGQATPFTIQAVFGGIDYRRQREQVQAGVDLLIGTPGRLIDYHKQRVYDLRSVEILVIDEADRMFDMGFIKDLRYILRQLPPFERRQSMLFSATLSYDVMELAYVFMNDAVRVSATPEQVTAEKVEHLVYHVGTHEKLPLLIGLLRRQANARVLIFVNMRRTAERLERTLEANGLAAAAITGDVDQRRRLRILADFKEGRLPILIATDVASRGLHIEGVTHVINYDLPLDPEDYVHRVGRTARAGASGTALSLACEAYVDGLEAIESYIGFKLPYEITDDTMLAHPVKHPPRVDYHGARTRRGAPATATPPSTAPSRGRPRPRASRPRPTARAPSASGAGAAAAAGVAAARRPQPRPAPEHGSAPDARWEPAHAHAGRRPPRVRAHEAAHDLARDLAPERPLGGPVETPPERRQADPAHRPPVAVRRLPVEPPALDVGDLAPEPGQQRRQLAVDRDVARPRRGDQPGGVGAREDERRRQPVDRRAETEPGRDQAVDERLGRVERQVVRAVRLLGPPHDQHRVAGREPQHARQLARRAPRPAQHAVEVDVVDARRAAAERVSDRTAIERAAQVAPRVRRVNARAREQRLHRRRRRRAGGDRHRPVQAPETGEPGFGVGQQRARRIVQRRRQRHVEGPHAAHPAIARDGAPTSGAARYDAAPTTPAATSAAIRLGS